MMHARTFAAGAAAVALLSQTLQADDLTRYRAFQLGSGLAAVATASGVNAIEAKTLHQRPAVLQDLAWRPSQWKAGTVAASNDPVEQIVFSFYDDQLFRIVVDYSRDRTEGMTAADLIESISAIYGTPAKGPFASRTASRVEMESGSALARWGAEGHAVVLYKTSTFHDAFRLIVTSPSLDDLALKAAAQSVKLNQQEAPSREAARLKKAKDDAAAVAESARAANKKVFWP